MFISQLHLPFYSQENLFIKYGKKYSIQPELLWAIAKQESNFNPNVINKNNNGSIDVGLMQINSVHFIYLETLGISKEDLLRPEINIDVGAKILFDCFKKYGNNYKSLNCYNGRIKNNSYYKKVISHIKEARAKRDLSRALEYKNLVLK